ncbi:phage tail protein [Streptomyces sp. NPDC056149]|uniref:phage tail protein n=1 Tax=unclassified Streptomyces TaxID=2593676 RepID=UPI002381835B|nr:phage tail protein [Streptomyces sp. WZ-12]
MTLEETPETRRPSAVTVELGAFQVETVRSVSGTAFGAAAPGGLPDGAGRPGEITIVRGPDQSAAFTDWLTRCLAERAVDRPRQTVTVVHYAADRTPLRRYRLAGARPTTWETPEDGAPAESVTLTYEELTVTT